MTREEAISEWTFRSNYIKKWLDEYGEEPSIRHYVELIDLAIEALQREEAEEKGYCHRIKPKEHLKNDAIQGEWIGLSECSLCGKQAYDFIEGCVEGVEYLSKLRSEDVSISRTDFTDTTDIWKEYKPIKRGRKGKRTKVY